MRVLSSGFGGLQVLGLGMFRGLGFRDAGVMFFSWSSRQHLTKILGIPGEARFPGKHQKHLLSCCGPGLLLRLNQQTLTHSVSSLSLMWTTQ